ncbi:MAG: thiamine-binding protein [Evtepia sp.]|uniref:thiamine-binding protein n=1 Tax=Evtepia sp. TaxID=2773933 RepID=UPI002A75A8AA|nr:thiamine-binding protein [Evtepia sp.]MDY3013938.1 thiamine-binding protein [Evtepia sp.]
MSASIAIQVLPQAENDQELCRIVDEVIDYIRQTSLRYEVGPFETTIEGDSYDQLMDIAKECQHVAIRAGAPKVSAYIKVVYRPEGDILTIDQKIGKYQNH